MTATINVGDKALVVDGQLPFRDVSEYEGLVVEVIGTPDDGDNDSILAGIKVCDALCMPVPPYWRVQLPDGVTTQSHGIKTVLLAKEELEELQ